MWKIYQITAPQNQENNLDPHESNVLFLGTHGKQASDGQVDLRNLSELKEPPEDPYDKGILTYINNLTTYVLDLTSNFLGFTRDAEASDPVLD